jgi:hypothetical protein
MFKVEHDQMQTLQSAFGHHSGSCYYVFPDVGNLTELASLHSDVVGHSWLVDVANLPSRIPPPFKNNSTVLRKDNCHFAYLGNPAAGVIQFHSQSFPVRGYKAKEIARRPIISRDPMPTEEMVRVLKAMHQEEGRKFFRNTVMAVLPEYF